MPDIVLLIKHLQKEKDNGPWRFATRFASGDK